MKALWRALAAALLAVLLLAPAWLLATESGLRAALALAGTLTGGALSVGGAEGRLLGDVSLRDFAWRDETVDLTVDRADLNLRLSRLLIGRVQAEYLAIGTLAIVVHDDADGAPDETPLTVTTPVRLAIEDGRLDAFRLRRSGWSRDWTLADARFGARWRDQWIVVGVLRATTVEAGPVELRGRVAIVDDLLLLEDIEGRRGGGEVRVAGALAIGDRAENALDVSWSRLELPADLAPWFSSARGESRLDGRWDDYRWRASAEVRLQDIPGRLVARGRGDLDSLTVARGELAALGGVARAEGRLQWSPRLATEATLAWQDIDPAAVWGEWPGRLNGSARLQAHRGESLRLEFDGALRDSQLRGYPFALQATGRTEGGKVFLRELALQSGPSLLAARGQLLPELALSGELHSTDLRSLWAGLSGHATLRATAAGPLEAPRLTARGEAGELVLGGVRVTRATLDGLFDPRGVSRFDLALDELDIGVPLRSLRLSGGGRRAAHRLEVALQGRESSARFAFDGGVRAGGWRGALVEAQVQPVRGATWSLEEPAALSFARGLLQTEPACLAAAGSRACAQLGLAADRQDIAFRLRAFDLAHLRAWLPSEWLTSGELSGSAAFTLAGGELAALRADLESTAGAVEGVGVRLDYGPSSLQVETEDARLNARLLLRPAGGEVRGEVRLAPGPALLDRPMRGELRLSLPDLTWLPVLSPEIASAQGSLDAELRVSGTPRSPSLDGALRIADGRVRLTTPGIELTRLSASFERGGRDAPLRLRAEATSGEGLLGVDGELRSLQPRLAGELTVRGDNVLGVNRPEIRAWLSPDLKLALDGRDARLSGTLGVPRADITPSRLERGGVGPSADQVIVEARDAPPPEGRGVRVTSEVRIVLGEQVRFDGLGLKTRLAGAITAMDDPARPTRGRGELRLEGGRYKAYGQDLQIETGRLLFAGGPVTDPAIDLTAYRKPREDIKVGLKARGPLAAPEFSLFSEPAMSQEEQLSWLVLGRSLSATLDAGQRTELSSAAVSLGLTGGEYLAQQLAPRLGLDEVTLGARPGEAAELARLTIGKYLSPKLFVSYGYGLFEPGHFFRLQYDLAKRVKLVGESGVQQGGDVLYTIER